MQEGVGLALHRFEMGTNMGMGSLYLVCTVTSPIRLLLSALMSSSAGHVLQVFAMILLKYSFQQNMHTYWLLASEMLPTWGYLLRL